VRRTTREITSMIFMSHINLSLYETPLRGLIKRVVRGGEDAWDAGVCGPSMVVLASFSGSNRKNTPILSIFQLFFNIGRLRRLISPDPTFQTSQVGCDLARSDVSVVRSEEKLGGKGSGDTHDASGPTLRGTRSMGYVVRLVWRATG